MITNNFNIIDGEMAKFDDQTIKTLTFDIVQPIRIDGNAEIYRVNMEIEMSNGDTINYYYNEGKPYSSGKQTHYCEIGEEKFNMGDFDFEGHPAMFIRGKYLEILKRRILK
ncbi:hypothetical protein D3C87_82670 [compost metagenome]